MIRAAGRIALSQKSAGELLYMPTRVTSLMRHSDSSYTVCVKRRQITSTSRTVLEMSESSVKTVA